MDESSWPIDPLTDEPFDPDYEFTFEVESETHTRNLSTLWQIFKVSGEINDPITETDLTQEQLEDFCTKARDKEVISPQEFNATMNKYYPLYLQNKLKNAIKNKQIELIKAGFNGDCEKVVEIFLEQGDNITGDKFVPDKLFSVQDAGLVGMLPECVKKVNAIMGIAFGCDVSTFINACENGCTPTEKDPDSLANAFHCASLSSNLPILRLMEPYGGDMFADSAIGSVFENVGNLLFAAEPDAVNFIEEVEPMKAVDSSSVASSTDDELEVTIEQSFASPVPAVHFEDPDVVVTVPYQQQQSNEDN